MIIIPAIYKLSSLLYTEHNRTVLCALPLILYIASAFRKI